MTGAETSAHGDPFLTKRNLVAREEHTLIAA